MKGIRGIGFGLVCAFCVFVFVGIPLSSAELPKVKMKSCEVSLVNMENIFSGKESITLAPYFEIANPNNFPIRIAELNYEIFLKDYLCAGKSMPLNYYIPARSKITVSSAFSITWTNMAIWVWGKGGFSMADATKEILPLWKNLNGELFSPPMKEIWDKVPEEYPQYLAKGQIDMIVPKGGKLSSNYSTTWKSSSDYVTIQHSNCDCGIGAVIQSPFFPQTTGTVSPLTRP